MDSTEMHALVVPTQRWWASLMRLIDRRRCLFKQLKVENSEQSLQHQLKYEPYKLLTSLQVATPQTIM